MEGGRAGPPAQPSPRPRPRPFWSPPTPYQYTETESPLARGAQVFSSCSYITPSVEAPEEGGAGLGAVARYVSEPRRK